MSGELDQACAEAAQYRADLEAEWDGGRELRTLMGAREQETFWGVVERVVAERDALRAARDATLDRERADAAIVCDELRAALIRWHRSDGTDDFLEADGDLAAIAARLVGEV